MKTEIQIEIEQQLRTSPTSAYLYSDLGDCLLESNPAQAYLCYENAAFFCEDDNTRGWFESKMRSVAERHGAVPKAAIVILSYNLQEYTQNCIESIRETTPVSAREIIVVDNASSDGSVEYLKSQSDIILQVNTENSGFPGGCNQGICLAQPDSDIFLLNNDTVMCENTLFWLRMGLYEEDYHGTVGCASNFVGNDQNIAPLGRDIDFYKDFARKNNIPNDHALEYKTYLVGFALLIKRKVMNLIGMLDENFFPGNYEDNDYGLRVLQAGYENVFVRNSFLVHFGSKSFGKVIARTNVLGRNQHYLEIKYGEPVAHYMHITHELIQVANYLDDIPENAKVLEVNCGLGENLLRMKYDHPGWDVHGADRHRMAELFAARHHMVKVKRIREYADILENEATYDLILLYMDDIPGAELGTIMKCVRLSLKKGGSVAIILTNPRYFMNWSPRMVNGDPGYNTVFVSTDEVNESIKFAGLTWQRTLTDFAFTQPNNFGEKSKAAIETLPEEDGKACYIRSYGIVAKLLYFEI